MTPSRAGQVQTVLSAPQCVARSRGGGSETLAGRIAYHELSGFTLAEVDPSQ